MARLIRDVNDDFFVEGAASVVFEPSDAGAGSGNLKENLAKIRLLPGRHLLRLIHRNGERSSNG
jgi:hypothetical protein